jgi:hypothetical protein
MGPARAQDSADRSVRQLGDVRKLRVRVTPKGATCKLRLELPLDSVLGTVDVRRDRVEIRLNDMTIFALPDAAERERLREPKPYRWKFRARRPLTRLKLDLARRDVRLLVRKVDLSGVFDRPDEGVKVSLDLGERTFETVVDVVARGRIWKLRPDVPVGGTPPNDPGDPGGGGGPGAVQWTLLEQNWASGVEAPETAVARTAAEWAALWTRHHSQSSPEPPRPSVDFSSQMVVGVFLGNRPDPSHLVEIAQISRDGATTTVAYHDVRLVPSSSGACFFPAVIAQPTVLVSVPRNETVTFTGRTLERGCP